MTAEKICEELNIDYSQVLNIYMYGSRVYLTNDEYSDYDFIIVYKSSFLPSGAFRDNAISSHNKMIQGVCYSRSGFIDAINNYEIGALECIFLPEDKIVQKKIDFKLNKYYEKDFIKKIISKASSSWYNSTLAYKDCNTEYIQKNIFHALRILDFGIQIKENKKIINYSSMNDIKNEIFNNDYVKPYDYYNLFMELQTKLKDGVS